MDFMKWIKSLDELLFELMSWLLFWPATMAKTLARPISMMRYADAQLARPEDEQYDEALSPPVFLVLTLLAAHFGAKALGQSDVILASRTGMAAMIDDDTSAIALRIVLFAAYPLVFSVILLASRRRKLSRRSLQLPFYSQCYPAAVFAAFLGLASDLSSLHIGPSYLFSIMMIGALLWLTVVEATWFRKLYNFGWGAALGLATTGMILGSAIVIGAALLFVSPPA